MKPIEDMTDAEIADFVEYKVLEQGGAAFSDLKGICVYHDETTGRKCAVGHLLDDEALQKAVYFGGGVSTLEEDGNLPAHLVKHVNLLVSLQCAHDACTGFGGAHFAAEFNRRMSRVRENYAFPKYSEVRANALIAA